MPTRQTTIFAHFSPRSDMSDGSSAPGRSSRHRTQQSSPPLRAYRLPSTDSEGSEGLAAIKFNSSKKPWNPEAVPMSQKRIEKRAVRDSDDERGEEEDDGGFTGTQMRRKRSKEGVGKGGRPKRLSDAEAEISITLNVDDGEEEEEGKEGKVIPPQQRRRQTGRTKDAKHGEKAITSPPPQIAETEDMPHAASAPSPSVGSVIIVDDDQSSKAASVQDVEEVDPPVQPKETRTRRAARLQSGQKPPIVSTRSLRERTQKPTLARRTAASTEKSKSTEDPPRSASRAVMFLELPRLSQEQRSRYSTWTPSPQPEARSAPALTISVAIEEAAALPSDTSGGPSKPVEVELSDKDLELLTDDDSDNVPLVLPSSARRGKATDDMKLIEKRKGQGKELSVKTYGNGTATKRVVLDVDGSEPDSEVSSFRKPGRKGKIPSLSTKPKEPTKPDSASDRRRSDKPKGKRPVSSEDDSDMRPVKKQMKSLKRPQKAEKRAKHSKPVKHGKLKSIARDPDEQNEAETASEDDMLEELAIDEPERFKSATRLRKKKESAYQRAIRKAKNKRLGISESTTEDESEAYTSDSAPTSEEEDSADEFIVDDGGQVQDGLLPHQFSLNSAQTPEFKFKVVFHYMVMLVVNGPKLLPLRGDAAEYFAPMLQDQRRRMEGYKNSRVRSQIWRPNFVKALELYPTFRATRAAAEEGCDACHLTGRKSTWHATFEGEPYDRETHEVIDTDSEDDKAKKRKQKEKEKRRRRRQTDDTNSDSESEGEKLPRELLLGRHCKERSQVYHQMSHWEDELYYRVRQYYRDLCRAKWQDVSDDSNATSSDSDVELDSENARKRRHAREARRVRSKAKIEVLRRGQLVGDCRNVDQVTEWMDGQGYQTKDFRWIEDIILDSERLEHDKNKGDRD